jgi:uncharacterized protein
MLLVAESHDDKLLSKQQRFEEQLGSVDYDVYVCASCRAVKREAYVAIVDEHDKCPKCGTVASTTTETEIEEATTSASGVAEVFTHCAFCGHERTTRKRTPRLARASGFGGGSSSGGFGGGSSSGGGASGRW